MSNVVKWDEAQELTPTQASGMREEGKKLAHAVASNAWKLAEHLFRVAQDQVRGKVLWEHWGHKSWQDYVESEIGIRSVRAEALVRTWYFYETKIGTGWARSSGLPFAHLKSLTKIVTVENADELAKRSEGTTLQRVDAMVKTEVARQKGVRQNITGLMMYDFHARLTAKELRDIDQALAAGRDKFQGNSRRGYVLAEILREWSGKPTQAERKAAKKAKKNGEKAPESKSKPAKTAVA